MKSLLLRRFLPAALSAQCAVGCGLFKAPHKNHRSPAATARAAETEQPQESADAEAPTQNEVASSSGSDDQVPHADAEDLNTGTSGAAPVVVDKLDHSFRSYFYQGAAALADLFATPGTPSSSMLCFPAALAYQAEYRRVHAAAPAAKLKDGTEQAATDAAIAGKDVRFVTDFCKADLKKGMTIPQGVGCISRLFTASALKAQIQVIGQDAQWSSFGMYPAGTKIDLRSVTPGDLHALLQSDESIIALVGAYVKDGDKMKRIKGHFVSLTGYTHAEGAQANDATIRVVDPSVDYARKADAVAADSVVMTPRSQATAPLLPEHAGFELRGLSLGVPGAVILVESVIAFH